MTDEPGLFHAGVFRAAAEEILTEQLHPLVQQLGLDEKGFKPVTTWKQVPNLKALSSAKVPAGAITSRGTVRQSQRRGDGRYDAVYDLEVGIFDRDTDYTQVADRTQQWAALLRAVLLRNPSLNGTVDSLVWVDEGFDEITDRASSKTIGGCSVLFHVGVENVVDLSALAGTGPTVLTVHPDVIASPPERPY